MGQHHKGTLRIDPFADDLTVKLKRLVTGTADKAICESLGELLFSSLFHGGIGALFHRSLGSVRARGAGLCIRLGIAAPEIAALPWELLYYRDEDCFIATSRETPLLRYLELPTMFAELDTELPLKALLVIPDSVDLDTAGEEELIVRSFSELNEKARAKIGREAINWEILNGEVTADRINNELNRKEYHIIHFIGHGTFEAGQGHLQLTPGPEPDNDGSMTAENFALFFLGNHTVKLVVLNSCKSATNSFAQLLTGVGQQVLKRSVPAVVAMQFSVTDTAARHFADVFYQNFCIGSDPGRVDTAVCHARRWVMQTVGKTADFVSPVLFMRSINGILFDYEEATPKRTPIDEIHRVQDLTRTRQSNLNAPEITQQQIAGEKDALKNLQKRLLRVYGQVFAASLPKLAILVLVVGLIGFFAYHTKFFNILNLDDLWRHKFVSHLSGHVDNSISDSVRIIFMGEGDNQGLGPFSLSREDEGKAAEWRRRHAKLIDGLRTAGAKVVAFDLVFSRPTQEDANQAMCDAISRAEASGQTAVISGMRWENNKPLAEGETTPKLRACLKESWGNTHVGLERWKLVQEYELASRTPDQSTGSLIPSLALQAVAASDPRGGPPLYNEATNKIQVSSLAGPKEIPIKATGPNLNMPIGYADEEDLKDVTRDYTTILERLQRGDAATYTDFAGRIVLVGAGGDDRRNVLGGSAPRYGVHIHANVISNILINFYLSELSTFKNILMILVMAGIGILIQTRFRSWLRPTVPLPLSNAEIKLPILFVVIIGAYLVFAFRLFQRPDHIIIDVSYHLFAFAIAFFAVEVFRQKLGLK